MSHARVLFWHTSATFLNVFFSRVTIEIYNLYSKIREKIRTQKGKQTYDIRLTFRTQENRNRNINTKNQSIFFFNLKRSTNSSNDSSGSNNSNNKLFSISKITRKCFLFLQCEFIQMIEMKTLWLWKRSCKSKCKKIIISYQIIT